MVPEQMARRRRRRKRLVMPTWSGSAASRLDARRCVGAGPGLEMSSNFTEARCTCRSDADRSLARVRDWADAV